MEKGWEEETVPYFDARALVSQARQAIQMIQADWSTSRAV